MNLHRVDLKSTYFVVKSRPVPSGGGGDVDDVAIDPVKFFLQLFSPRDLRKSSPPTSYHPSRVPTKERKKERKNQTRSSRQELTKPDRPIHGTEPSGHPAQRDLKRRKERTRSASMVRTFFHASPWIARPIAKQFCWAGNGSGASLPVLGQLRWSEGWVLGTGTGD